VVKELGRKVFAEEGFYSNTITGFILENADDYRKKLREKHKLVTARDFGELKGRFFRICHLGHIETDQLKLALSYIKDVVGGS
jgi:aspartate aminotransferase-like enzyme